MKIAIIWFIASLLIHAADEPSPHTPTQKVLRAAFWPVTLYSLFRSQSIALHRLLTITWTCLTGSWFLSLLWDRL